MLRLGAANAALGHAARGRIWVIRRSVFSSWRLTPRTPRAGADGGASGFLSFMAPLFLIAIIFYFLLDSPAEARAGEAGSASQGPEEE